MSAAEKGLERADNRVLAAKLAVIVAGMFAFGYALVPFYEKICEAAGLRTIGQPDPVSDIAIDNTRTVRIEFDSNVSKLAWRFRPLEPIVGVHPGEMRQVMFEIVNTSDHAVTGQAVPSYAPQQAAQYFRKLECFCFSMQTLQAGEARQMPVVFLIDSQLPKDVGTITLSYTFFVVEGAGKG